MNKKIVFAAAAFISTIPLASVFAEETVTNISTDSSQVKIRQIPNGNKDQIKVDLRAQNQARQEAVAEKADLKQQREDIKEQKSQGRCKNIQTRIDTQTKRYENSKKMLVTVFGNMKARLVRLSERLAGKGVDVTKLNADIATLDTMIAKLSADHDAFMASLTQANATATTECATTPSGNFMGKLLGTRKIAQTVEQDRIEIRNFFQTTIKSDILAIRKQLESQKAAETTKETAEEKTKELENKTKAGKKNSTSTTTPETTVAQ